MEPLKFDQEEKPRHPLITEKIYQGDFGEDEYTCIHELKKSQEEYLIFVIHGIGHTLQTLKSILTKIHLTVQNLYGHKKRILSKQLHIRLIDWKSRLIKFSDLHFANLIDKNNETKYPKIFINQTPLDVLYYLSETNKYEILNDMVTHMNDYYECVKKYRPLFKGGVSVVSHSLGAVMLYHIITNMSYVKENINANNNNNNNISPFSCADGGNILNSSQIKKKFSFPEVELQMEHSFLEKMETNQKDFLKINRKNRVNNLNQFKIKEKVEEVVSNFEMKINENNLKLDSIDNDASSISVTQSQNTEIPGDPEKMEKENTERRESFSKYNTNTNTFQKHIFSHKKEIQPLKFPIDHFFMCGSPLSLFLTIDQKENACLEEMEIVKDFHNIIHPMDPVAYRIEPLIFNYPETECSFTLPHWENDGVKNALMDHLFEKLCCIPRKIEYLNHDKKIGRKRYDFMVQESPSEKAVNVIGFLFSHMAYWNNPDVFYFIIKTIHWQGYSTVDFNQINMKDLNNYSSEL